MLKELNYWSTVKVCRWYLTYDIETPATTVRNQNICQQMNHMISYVDNYYYDDATNKIVDEVYYIGNTSDISKNFYADSFTLDTSDYVRIDLFESDSAIQPMTVSLLAGLNRSMRTLRSFNGNWIGNNYCCAQLYVYCHRSSGCGDLCLDQENYDYWRARSIRSGSVWIGPGIYLFATAVILLYQMQEMLAAKTPGLASNCLHQCILQMGWRLWPPIFTTNGCVGYYYHYHPELYL